MDRQKNPTASNSLKLVETALRENGFDCDALDWLHTPAADQLGGYLSVVEIVMTVEVDFEAETGFDLCIPDEAYDPETITLEGLVKVVDRYLP